MASTIRNESGGTFSEGYPRGSHLGIKWFIFRTIAFILGATGWACAAIGAFYAGMGVILIRWAKRVHEAADEIRYEA